MHISIFTGTFYKIWYIKILDLICEIGCKNIKIFLHQAFRDIPFDFIEKEINKKGLNVLSIRAPLGLLVKSKYHDNAIQICSNAINYYKQIDAPDLLIEFEERKAKLNLRKNNV